MQSIFKNKLGRHIRCAKDERVVDGVLVGEGAGVDLARVVVVGKVGLIAGGVCMERVQGIENPFDLVLGQAAAMAEKRHQLDGLKMRPTLITPHPIFVGHGHLQHPVRNVKAPKAFVTMAYLFRVPRIVQKFYRMCMEVVSVLVRKRGMVTFM